MDRESGRGGVGLDVGAELQSIRSDGEIAVGADARVVSIADAHREAVHLGYIEPGEYIYRLKVKSRLNPDKNEKQSVGSDEKKVRVASKG